MILSTPKIIKGLSILLLILGTHSLLQAQSPDPGIGGPGSGSGPNGTPVGDGGPVVPFDGGMSLIFAASGISYAAKKLKARKEANSFIEC